MEKFSDYLIECREHCSERITSDWFSQDTSQTNALRVETVRDKSDRCGMKMPEHWSKEAKKRGWGIWVYSGGDPSVFGFCNLNDCPLMEFFKKTAPNKKDKE